MADDFYLDKTTFEEFLKKIADTGAGLTAAHRALNDVLVRTQGCWGDDEIGMAFQNNYWSSAEEVRTGTAQAGDGLTEFTGSARRNADTLLSVDEQTARYLDSQAQEP